MTIQERAALVLQQIDAELARARKPPLGPWETDLKAKHPAVFTEDGDFVGVDMTPATAAFIATSRMLTPKSLRCLKTGIEGLLTLLQLNSTEEMLNISMTMAASEDTARVTLTTLCDQWEAEQS